MALTLALTAVAACGRESDVALRRTEPRSPGRMATTTTTTVAEAGTFPVTVDGTGGPLTVVRRPERIVSLSASVTEVLYAIEAGDQVVGVDQGSGRPVGAPVVPGLRADRPAADVVERLRPDLVVVEDDGSQATVNTHGLPVSPGVPVLEIAVPDTLDESYAAIEALGRVTGHLRRAGEVVEGMRRDIAALLTSAGAATRPGRGAVYHELDDQLFTVTSLSFVGRIYRQLGFTNVGDGVESGEGYRYGQLSNEELAEQDPAWIVLAHDAGCDPAATLAARGWGALRAVRDGHVAVVDRDLARTWGPRAVDLIRRIVTVTGLVEPPRGRPNQDGRAALRPLCGRQEAPDLPLPSPPATTPRSRSRPPTLQAPGPTGQPTPEVAPTTPRPAAPTPTPSTAAPRPARSAPGRSDRPTRAATTPARAVTTSTPATTAVPPASAPPTTSTPPPTVVPAEPPVLLAPTAPPTPTPAALTIEPLAAQPGVAPVVTRVETDDPVVFLTIDDGTVRFPAAQAVFQQKGIPATWFLIDEPITAEPEFFRPLLRTSLIESHTRTHPDLRGLTEAQQREEICGNADGAARAFGQRPVLFRPPYGLYDAATQRAAAACGMQAVVLWEQNVNHDMVGFRRRPEFRPGDIILMHLRPQFVEELNVIEQRVAAAGLRFALLEDYLVP